MRLLTFLLLFVLLPLRLVAAQPAPIPTPERVDAWVLPMDSRLRLHPVPVLESETLVYVEPVTPVMLVGRTRDNQWLEIRLADGMQGWVVGEFLDVLVSLESLAVTSNALATPGGYLISPAVADQLRQIFQRGQTLGNRSDVFTKAGDSITVAPHTLQPIGLGLYNLGDFQYLQGVIDYFSVTEAREGNSFVNVSVAAANGWTTDAVLDPLYADPHLCRHGDSPLTCELRLTRPSIILVMFGTNDTAHLTTATYEYNLWQIVDISLENGVIPVLSTLPVRLGYEEQTAEFNRIVAEVTARYDLPMWDYGAALASLPNLGLGEDGVHPSMPPRGFKGSADFRAENLYYGFVIRNLTALQMLDMIWREIDPSAA